MPMRLIWMTDLHLDHAKLKTRREFYKVVRHAKPDRLLIGGDTGEADNLYDLLAEIEMAVRCPVSFVLGNHDFYRGSAANIYFDLPAFLDEHPGLHWLGDADGGGLLLRDDVALVGHGGWGDARLGDVDHMVMTTDDMMIHELRFLSHQQRVARLNKLGDDAAAILSSQLEGHAPHVREVLVLTHVPPFEAACWHEGRISDPPFLPRFTWQAGGAVLQAAAGHYPNTQFTVLCGHTHSGGDVRISDNLRVITGPALYKKPRLNGVLTLADETPVTIDIVN